MEGNMYAVPSNVEEVLEAAHALAPCDIEPWGGWITWHAYAFDECAGHVAGFRDVFAVMAIFFLLLPVLVDEAEEIVVVHATPSYP